MATGTIILPINGATPNASNPPGLRFEDNRPEWLFDDSTPETVFWTFRMPQDCAAEPGLTAKIQYKMASDDDSDHKVEFEVSVFAISDGDSADVDTEDWDDANSGSANIPGQSGGGGGQAGYLDEISITLSNDDSVAAGDFVMIALQRDADDGTNDTATGDCEVVNVSLEYTTS